MSATTDTSANLGNQFDHERCLLCGERNPWSLKLTFLPEGQQVTASFQPHPGLQGYGGVLHGGVISALLDAAMTHCLFHQGVRAVTGDLHVRFLRPVPCRQALELKAWLLSAAPPLYRLKAELTAGGLVMAWAEAKFVQEQKIRPASRPVTSPAS